MQPEPLIKWQAYEYPFKKRTSDWYWALGILTLALLAVAILLKNFLFGVLVVLSGILLLLFSIRKPAIVTFEIVEKGIIVQKNLHPFKELSAFHILDNEPHKLLLESKRLLAPIISISLENVASDHVSTLLKERLPEKELHESLPVYLFERLWF